MSNMQKLASGQMRREAYPVSEGANGIRAPQGWPAILVETSADWDKDLVFEHGYHLSQDGQYLFYFCVRPKDLSKIERVTVAMHGYTCSTAWNTFNIMVTHAKLYNSAVIGCDMPGHGRSDGLFLHVPDWFEFVKAQDDFVERVAIPYRNRLSREKNLQDNLSLFGHGESMGGAVLCTLAIQKPKLFDGIVLACPMLFVADAMRPPYPVAMFFKHVMVPLFPKACMTPSADLDEKLFTDKELCKKAVENPYGPQKAPLRLETARTFGFVVSDWFDENIKKLETPFIIVHGAADEVTDPKLSQRVHDEAKSEDKTIKLYPNAKHGDILHGGEKMKATMAMCYQDVGEWQKKRTKLPQRAGFRIESLNLSSLFKF